LRPPEISVHPVNAASAKVTAGTIKLAQRAIVVMLEITRFKNIKKRN
jgi:hypothetical protein